ncbi:glycosyltransferase family 2 protein [Alkaliflexus imshenetskii]|uniref:glycosyltransferase family 2 protein n=1 Tax=Alkaliflexus imshenetskii TaxID=286730 RepID=UPI00047E4C1C|nr:glycosyltransferase family 2 protein [Alkaliflexus imshenetskii]
MTVSVIILNWNTKELLGTFLPEVVKHSAMPGVDVVLADNGSSDGSVEWVKENFPEVKILAFGENMGFAGGYNRALSLVDTELSVLLNSDVAPGRGWLVPLIALMASTPTAAACVPKIKDYKKPSHFEYAGAAGGFIDFFGYPFCRGRIFNVAEEDQHQYDKAGPIFWGSGAALMVRTSLFIESGGLDSDFFAHMEEIDWCWRVKNQGHSIFYVPSSEVFHLGGGTLNYENPNKTYLNFRNNLFLLLKNKAGFMVFPLIIARFFLDFAALLNFLVNGEKNNAFAVSKAHRHFLKYFIKFYRKRNALKPLLVCRKHSEIYKGSVVMDFFIRKKRYFSELRFFI